MTVHAYDPIGLESLLRRMADAADELRGLHCADPLADAAISAARRIALDLVTRWMPLARSVLCSDPLGRTATPTTIDDWLAPRPHRLDPTTTRALFDALADTWPTDLAADHDALVVLAAHLRLIADTDRRAAESFIDLPGLAPLLEALAHEAWWLDPDSEHATAISQVLCAIGALLPTDGDALATLLDRLSPHAAALVVTNVALDPRDLADATARILVRRSEQPDVGTVSTAAQLVLSVVARDAAAARALLELTTDRPWLLHESGADPRTVADVVTTATDPATTDPCAAQMLVVPHATWLATHSTEGSSDLLADLLAPWLVHLGPLDRVWSLSVDERTWLLAAAIDDPVTMQRLTAIAERVHRSTIERTVDAGGRAIEEVAALLGVLSELVVRDAERRADRAVATWGLMLSIVGVAAALVPGGVVVGMASSVFFSVIAALPPVDRSAVAARADAAQEHALATGAAAVAVAVHRNWIDSGRVSATTPPPPLPDPRSTHPTLDFRRRFDDWLDSLPGGWSGPLAAEADRFVSSMLNAHGAGTELAD